MAAGFSAVAHGTRGSTGSIRENSRAQQRPAVAVPAPDLEVVREHADRPFRDDARQSRCRQAAGWTCPIGEVAITQTPSARREAACRVRSLRSTQSKKLAMLALPRHPARSCACYLALTAGSP